MPVWHRVTRVYVDQHSLALADKVGAAAEKGIRELPKKIKQIVSSPITFEEPYFKRLDPDNVEKVALELANCYQCSCEFCHHEVALRPKN